MEQVNRRLLSLSDAELFESIGSELVGRSAFPRTKEELVETGRAWYQANVGKICAIICPHAPELLKETNFEKLVTIVADMLAAALFSITPFKISILVARVGIEKLCPLTPKQ